MNDCMRKKYSDAMQYEPEKMEILFQVLDNENDVTLTDGKGLVLRVSDSYEDHYYVTKEEVEGRTVFELEDIGVFKPSVTAAVLRKKRKVTLLQTNKRGEIIISTGVPIFDDDKNIRYVISFNAIDIANMTTLYDNYTKLTELMREYSAEINQLRMKDLEGKELITKSKAMSEIIELITHVADTTANMLITGETGVGKSMIAKVAHKSSLRSDCPFIEINCGTIAPTLIESELFGYEKGAFTGAGQKGKIGKIELANEGTLFLDDIGELSIDMQTKLLQVIQEKVITRIGGLRKINIDFRLIAATNKDLKKAIKEGTFREDLFYRLNVINIHIPALRERREDIIPLAKNFLTRFNNIYNKDIFIPHDIMKIFEKCDWPGNTRQLENLIERLVVTSKSNVLTVYDLPDDINFRTNYLKPGHTEGTLKSMLCDFERTIFLKAFEKYKTSVSVGKALGVSQTTAARKLRKYIPGYTKLKNK